LQQTPENALPKRDYYEVLEVHRNAGETEIKKAYRKLAMRYHPDRNPGDAEAELRFKELAEAYEVLSDATRRAHYDQFGHPEEGGQRAYSAQEFDFHAHVDDLFGEIFGDLFGQRRGRGPRPERGQDLRYELTVEFRDAIFGCTREIEIPVRRACEGCKGSGAKPGTSPASCSRCQGRGRMKYQQGFFTIERECTTCGGTGRVNLDPCVECQGRGTVERMRRLTIQVPPGVETGTRLRLTGEGEGGRHGGPSGDLYVVIAVREHPIFARQGSDVICEVPVSFVQAALGAEVEVPTLEGGARVQIPSGTQHGTVLTLKGRGGPKGRFASRGDQKIVIAVEIPRRLSNRQVEILQEFQSLEEEDAQPGIAGFWEKVKKLFG
jgi:molecular chaperone DnaJ